MPSLVLPMTLTMSAVGDPEVFHDFKVGQFPVNGTFARASTVNGWTLDANGDPVLTEFAIDQPAFVIDPATGQSLGYRALQGVTNSLLWSRDLSNGVWSGTATIAQDAVGLDGAANTACTVTGDGTSSGGERSQEITVPDDSNTHQQTFYTEKNKSDSLRVKGFLSGGTTTVLVSVLIDTTDGTATGDTGNLTVEDKGNFWRIIINIANNGTGNTSLDLQIFPDEVNGTGSIVYDFGGVFLNESIAGPPIETEGSPVSTDVADGNEPVPTSLQSAGTLLISARTANGLSGDQVLAQMDDGTENNRVRLVRNSSREVHYIVTSGGAEVANLNLGTVADDTDTTVAIRYGDDDYAGIISGGTLQTDTTGTMPSISTLRHGRDTADGDEWNGTISDVRGDDAYTDTQLEEAV